MLPCPPRRRDNKKESGVVPPEGIPASSPGVRAPSPFEKQPDFTVRLPLARRRLSMPRRQVRHDVRRCVRQSLVVAVTGAVPHRTVGLSRCPQSAAMVVLLTTTRRRSSERSDGGASIRQHWECPIRAGRTPFSPLVLAAAYAASLRSDVVGARLRPSDWVRCHRIENRFAVSRVSLVVEEKELSGRLSPGGAVSRLARPRRDA